MWLSLSMTSVMLVILLSPLSIIVVNLTCRISRFQDGRSVQLNSKKLLQVTENLNHIKVTASHWESWSHKSIGSHLRTWFCSKSNTTGTTLGTGTTHLSGIPEFTTGFYWDSCYAIFSFMCMFWYNVCVSLVTIGSRHSQDKVQAYPIWWNVCFTVPSRKVHQ
jgi:hypothetical protein